MTRNLQLLKSEKGQAGTTILLSMIVALFILGLLVSIFAIMGAGVRDSATLKASETASPSQNTFTFGTKAVTLTVCSNYAESVVTAITVKNASSGQILTPANYTVSGCTLTGVAGSTFNKTSVNATYTITYEGTAYTTMNDTVAGISAVTDWFPILLVITSMLVLILLTVIIIIAIRGSGIMMGDSSSVSNGGISA